MSTTLISSTTQHHPQNEQEESRDLECVVVKAEKLRNEDDISSINFYWFLLDLKDRRLMEPTATVADIVAMMELQCCSEDEMAKLLEISPDEIRPYLCSSETAEQEPFELVMFEW